MCEQDLLQRISHQGAACLYKREASDWHMSERTGNLETLGNAFCIFSQEGYLLHF